MKLYYAPGTISLMPHVALLESGLAFVAVRVDKASKKTADGEDYKAVNPLGYIPALVLDDGSVLLEATAIAQFIADRDPTGKLAPPQGTIERARLQAWLNFLSSELHKELLVPCFIRHWTNKLSYG
jgi:glutathione S-transferase